MLPGDVQFPGVIGIYKTGSLHIPLGAPYSCFCVLEYMTLEHLIQYSGRNILFEFKADNWSTFHPSPCPIPCVFSYIGLCIRLTATESFLSD